MADGDRRVVAKLVLLMQASCDPALKGKSHVATLAVVLDACYEDVKCHIGPTSIGRIAGLHERTVRECLDQLEAAGYIRTQRRSERSEWIYPNFDHAVTNARLVSYDESQLRVHRPANDRTIARRIAGPQDRSGESRENSIAGLQAHDSGPVDAEERVRRPTETVLETVPETVTVSQLSYSPSKVEARFDEFWRQYPRKEAKVKAQAIWTKRKLDQHADAILADLQARAADSTQWVDPKFIPHPTTYLNQNRWQDEWPRALSPAPAVGRLPRETNADAINAESMRRLGMKP